MSNNKASPIFVLPKEVIEDKSTKICLFQEGPHSELIDKFSLFSKIVFCYIIHNCGFLLK